MKAIRLKWDVGEIIDILDELSSYQSEVDGYIDVISGPGMAMVVNDDAIFQNLKFNKPATAVYRNLFGHNGQIFGTVIIVGIKGDEFCELSAQQIEIVETVLRNAGFKRSDE